MSKRWGVEIAGKQAQKTPNFSIKCPQKAGREPSFADMSAKNMGVLFSTLIIGLVVWQADAKHLLTPNKGWIIQRIKS